jgi:hypothetical protein
VSGVVFFCIVFTSALVFLNCVNCNAEKIQTQRKAKKNVNKSSKIIPIGLTYYRKDKRIKYLESVSVWVCNSGKVVAKTQVDDT